MDGRPDRGTTEGGGGVFGSHHLDASHCTTMHIVNAHTRIRSIYRRQMGFMLSIGTEKETIQFFDSILPLLETVVRENETEVCFGHCTSTIRYDQ